MSDAFEMGKILEEFSRKASNVILMIDGQSFDVCLSTKLLEEKFF
jgi:hypothetical protein